MIVSVSSNLQIDLWCNGNTQDFDSWIRGSNPFRSSKMVSLAYLVKRPAVNGKNRVRVPEYTQKRNIVQLDRILGYDPKDASSNLAIPTIF